MPSFIDKLRKKKSQDQVNAGQVTRIPSQNGQPPEFRLFRQGTQDHTPEPIDDNINVFDKLQISSAEKSNGDNSIHNSFHATSPSSHRVSPSVATQSSTITNDPTSSSPRSTEKQTKRRTLSSIIRRPSQMSHRSRSSSYLPDFQPIDRNGDVEAQWEQRATMLARAGPPSPAIPRTDSIFDTGPPRLPPVELVTESSPVKSLLTRDSTHQTSSPSRSLSGPITSGAPALASAAPPPLYRQESTRAQRNRNFSNPSPIAEDGDFNHEEGQSRDDYLQSAIREHERGNLEISAQLFKKAAQGEGGLPMGQLMYGLSLRHGWGVERDEDRAINWLRLAASSSAAVEESALSAGMTGGGQMKGDLILAIFELGNCFRHGWGVQVDKDLARNYYETAANLGDADAMYEVAWCYETGFGLKKDKYKAAFYYRKAETHGSKVPGMQWIWKPKYNHDPFLLSKQELKQKVKQKS